MKMAAEEKVLYREYAGMPGWVWVIVGLGGVFGIVYILYQYFVAPGQEILDAYKQILEDIYKEEKAFLEENAELDPPIYGLNETQKQIIAAKEEAAERLRPDVEKILYERGEDIWDFLEFVAIAIIAVVAAPAVISALKNLVKEWRKKPESKDMQSSYGHSYIMHELVANEMALTGRLDIASGFQTTIQSLYTAYSEPALNAAITYYTSILPGLIPGTLEYIVVSTLLNYMTYEVSAVGIIGALIPWWAPI